MTDGIEDGGCKTCYLCNKQNEKTFRLYLWGLAGGKRKFLELIANLRNKGKGQHWGPVQTVSDVTSRQLYRTLIWSYELKKKQKTHTQKGRKHADSILYIFLLGLSQITYKLSWYSLHKLGKFSL